LADWLRSTGQPHAAFSTAVPNRAALQIKGIRNAGKLPPVSSLFVFGMQQFRFRDGGKKLATIM
jgi:hypothetical protein